MLSFNEERVFLFLLMTVNLIVLVHVINYVKGKKPEATEDVKFLIPFVLVIADFMFFLTVFGSAGSTTLGINFTQFITSIQSSVAFAFILSLVSLLFILWYFLRAQNNSFLSYSLLLSDLSIVLLAISSITGMVSPAIIPSSIQDYTGIAITSVIGIAFKVLERKDPK